MADDPILDYASPQAARAPDEIAPLAQGVAGFAWCRILGLLLTHMLAKFAGALSVSCIPIPMVIGSAVGLIYKSSHVRGGRVRGYRALAGAGLALLAVFYLWTIAWGDTRLRAEMEHGFRLPPSAHNLQCRGDALTTIADRAAITWFEIKAADLHPFLAKLKPSTNVPPLGAGLANPRYTGHRQTWGGTPKFNQILRCSSPVGDFLTVEVWDLPSGGHLIRMYTDWN